MCIRDSVRSDRSRANEFESYAYRPLVEPWKLLSAYEFLQRWRTELLLVPSYNINRGGCGRLVRIVSYIGKLGGRLRNGPNRGLNTPKGETSIEVLGFPAGANMAPGGFPETNKIRYKVDGEIDRKFNPSIFE